MGVRVDKLVNIYYRLGLVVDTALDPAGPAGKSAVGTVAACARAAMAAVRSASTRAASACASASAFSLLKHSKLDEMKKKHHARNHGTSTLKIAGTCRSWHIQGPRNQKLSGKWRRLNFYRKT